MRSATKKSGSKKSTKAKAGAKPNDRDLVPLTTIDKEKREAKKPKGKKTATPKVDAKPKALSCLDAAAQVLKAKGEAMNCKAMINEIFAKKLWHSDAPTPAATLSSAILREVQKKGKDARFRKVDRGMFAFNG